MDSKNLLFQLYTKGLIKEGKETSRRVPWWSHHRSRGKARKEELLMRKTCVAAQRINGIYFIFSWGTQKAP